MFYSSDSQPFPDHAARAILRFLISLHTTYSKI